MPKFFSRIGERILRLVSRLPKRKVALAYGIVLFLQLTYPRAMARPAMFLEGAYVGLQTGKSVQEKFQTKAEKLYIYLEDQKTETLSWEAGLNPSAENIENATTNYPLWQRFIPFSLFFTSTSHDPLILLDTDRLDAYVDFLYQKGYKAAVNANTARGEDNLYILVPGAEGREFPKEELRLALSKMPIHRQNELRISSKPLLPIITNQMVEEAIKKTTPSELKPLVVELDGEQHKIETQTLSSWMVISINEEAEKVELSFDEASMGDWIARNPGQANNSGSPTLIYVQDGVETGRKEGAAGKAVDAKVLIGDIKTAVEKKEDKVIARLVEQPVVLQYVRSYSTSSAGLKLLIDEWQKEYPGMQATVYIRQLGGSGLFAESSSHTKLFGASLYKLFVASYLLESISAGSINGSSLLTSSKSYNQCIDEMIRLSDNACPIAAVNKHSAGVFNQYISSKGFSVSRVSEESVTSSADMALFLQKLWQGTLLNASDSGKLMDYMRRQIYRAAIPAGSPGATVADKVGFYDSYWHDAAIVSSPSATYILVVMTKNGGPLAIKNLAQRVYETFN